MSFSTLFFLFVFLPVSLILYYVFPKKLRNIPLVVLSLVFYAWGNPVYLILLLLSMAFNYVSGLQIAGYKEAGRTGFARAAMIIAVAANLLLLGYFKYFAFLLETLNLIPGLNLSAPELSLPLGLSFYTFTVLSYILDVYMDRAPVQKNVLSYAVYATFFPKIISGPIVQYRDMMVQIEAERETPPAKIASGVNLFLVGLFKKVLLADNLGTVFGAVSGLEAMSIGTAWLGMVLYSLQLYFDFSGYSDMAIGLSKMLGFDLDKNFDYPYRALNITDFWRRWHISLGAWFREYVYIPLGGSRCSKPKIFRNLLIVWLLTGLWHGASWSFIAWGLWHGAFAMLERFVIKDKLDKVPNPIRIFGTCLIAFLGWVMFFSGSLSNMVHYFGQMFGAGHLGLFDSGFRYYFGSSWLLILAAVIGSGPLVRRLHQNLTYRRGGAAVYISAALYILLLVLCIASMVSSTYTSFLYFQF
ncbi:MAG: MBOAT family protein [Oscillospiraceae bacterium]|nr:MBOAT family protein [Oscillospiraceae bacterium]